ncbi:hypothetical protein AB0O86_07350 [Streptomyces hirsutus]|uniref:hypothetical protein n=1 Tax=Streptomyces hirsutus TaxID=35620 RepID=UPI003441F9F4
MVNDTTLLLDLDGMPVIRVERCEDGGRLAHLATADASARAPFRGHAHAPFFTKLARLHISETVGLNAFLLDQVAEP